MLIFLFVPLVYVIVIDGISKPRERVKQPRPGMRSTSIHQSTLAYLERISITTQCKKTKVWDLIRSYPRILKRAGISSSSLTPSGMLYPGSITRYIVMIMLKYSFEETPDAIALALIAPWLYPLAVMTDKILFAAAFCQGLLLIFCS